MLNIMSNYETTILKSTMQAQEESLRYLSNELHDNICHSLLLAILNLQKVHQREFQPSVRDSIHILKRTMLELSNLSKTLNGEMILSIGLKSAIQNQIDHLNNTERIKAFFTITGTDTHLNGDLELLLFRIIQEAISNVMKHAKASTLRILLSFKETELLLRIQDDGRGFDPMQVHPGCAGLRNIQHRVQLAEGSLKILSKPQKGSTLELLVPLQKPTL